MSNFETKFEIIKGWYTGERADPLITKGTGFVNSVGRYFS
jgi:hypothetical protein